MAATNWKTFAAHGMRKGETLEQLSAQWRGLKGMASGRTRRNPGAFGIPKIVLYAGGAYLADRFLLGGQIMNTITGVFKPKAVPVITGGSPPTSGL